MVDGRSQNLMLAFFLALFLASIALLGWVMWPFVSVIVLSAVLTGLFKPLWRKFCRHTRPTVASLLTCSVIFLIIFVPVAFFVGTLAREAYGWYSLGKNFVVGDQIRTLVVDSMLLEKANGFLSTFGVQLTGEDLSRAISEVGKIVGLFLYEQASAIASNILNFLVHASLMLLVVFYLLIDGERLIAYIFELSPLPQSQEEKLIGKFQGMAGAILVGNGLGGVIQGIAGGMVFSAFGFKSAFLWGVIMGLLAFLPIVGIGAVFVPAALYLFVVGRPGAGLFFFVFYALLSGGVEYLFKPRLVGHRVQMHTLLVFFSIIGGLKLFGLLGIIYGPLAATAFLTLADIYHVSYQRFVENELSVEASQKGSAV